MTTETNDAYSIAGNIKEVSISSARSSVETRSGIASDFKDKANATNA